ncbi:MAG TPA: hypothetical protein VFM18_02255 [Methanosarcina sp.]|nr:hypothetical protein [Methanosarcina sp.]
MATVKQIVGTRTSLNVTGFSTLASATYVASDAYNCTTNNPLDVICEVTTATTNTPTGNKVVWVFITESLDGTNYRSGPTSGTTTTDESDLKQMGVVALNTSTTSHRATFSVAQALGYVPAYFKLVFKNDLGVALTSASVYTSEISGTVV